MIDLTKPLLFLDIDGVVNSDTFFKTIEDNHFKRCTAPMPPNRRCTCFVQEYLIDKICIDRLNRIIKTTAAQVILSSSWRNLLHHVEVERILKMHGFEHTILDITPDLPNDPVYAKLRADNAIDKIMRGHEIAYWLETQLDVNPRFSATIAADALLRRLLAIGAPRFVILDDCNDMLYLKPWHVLTDAYVGLTDSDAEEAIELLTRIA